MPRWICWRRVADRYVFSKGRSESNTSKIVAGAPTEGATTAVDVPQRGRGAQRAADRAAAPRGPTGASMGLHRPQGGTPLGWELFPYAVVDPAIDWRLRVPAWARLSGPAASLPRSSVGPSGVSG